MSNFKRTLRLRAPQGFGGDFPKLFNTINDSVDGLVGIQAVFSGKYLAICFETEEKAQIAEAQGLDLGTNHYEFNNVGTRHTFVSCFVPIEVEDLKIVNLRQPYEDVTRIRRLKHKSPGSRKLGERVLTFSRIRKTLLSRLSFEGISVGFKYTGQPKS